MLADLDAHHCAVPHQCVAFQLHRPPQAHVPNAHNQLRPCLLYIRFNAAATEVQGIGLCCLKALRQRPDTGPIAHAAGQLLVNLSRERGAHVIAGSVILVLDGFLEYVDLCITGAGGGELWMITTAVSI